MLWIAGTGEGIAIENSADVPRRGLRERIAGEEAEGARVVMQELRDQR
jgi:hypothetical protein